MTGAIVSWISKITVKPLSRSEPEFANFSLNLLVYSIKFARFRIHEKCSFQVTLDWAKEKGSLSDIRLSPSEEILSGLNSGDFSRRASITSIPPLSPPKDESPLGGTSSFFRQNSFPSPNSEVDAAYQSTFEMQTRRNSMPVSIVSQF